MSEEKPKVSLKDIELFFTRIDKSLRNDIRKEHPVPNERIKEIQIFYDSECFIIKREEDGLSRFFG